MNIVTKITDVNSRYNEALQWLEFEQNFLKRDRLINHYEGYKVVLDDALRASTTASLSMAELIIRQFEKTLEEVWN